MPSKTTAVTTTVARAIAPISSQRKASGSAGVTTQARRAIAGVTKSATWALDETAISVASRIFPRRAITIAPPCSAALPTTATITIEMKNCERPAAFAKPSSEWTRISLVTAVAVVARASVISARRSDHASARSSYPDSACVCRKPRSWMVCTTT